MPSRSLFRSKTLSIAALALWVFSLPLTGIVLYSRHEHLKGYDILLNGWAAALYHLNFAWFANVCFLYCARRVPLGWPLPVKSAVVAALLSLDTFGLSSVTMDEGGATTLVYAYGWGAFLWFLAIGTMLIAVAVAQREEDALRRRKSFYPWLLWPGIAFILVITVATSTFALRDRHDANVEESGRLASLAFKRGKVCSAPVVSDIKPIQSLSGPLEFVIVSGRADMAYPFESVQRLLAWGIPSIRSAGRDYAYRNVAGINTLSSVAGSGEPGATLRAEFGPRSRTLELREGSSGRLVFARRWNLEVIGGEVHFFCPDYSESPRETEQPRLLLMQALGLNGIDSQALAEGRGHFYKDLFISQDVESAASMFVIPKRVRAQHAY